MDKIQTLLNYAEIEEVWKAGSGNGDSAKRLTLTQVEKFGNIISDDQSWIKLLEIFNNGRDVDAWLATDWPDGFDELILCVPLCKYVEFECVRCTVGKRQENNSCAHDYSLFGYIAELLKIPDRTGLIKHIESIKLILNNDEYSWNISGRMISS